jgi:hypothetical protein
MVAMFIQPGTDMDLTAITRWVKASFAAMEQAAREGHDYMKDEMRRAARSGWREIRTQPIPEGVQ